MTTKKKSVSVKPVVSSGPGPECPTAVADQKLDPAFKAKWVAALRSGEFKQHRDSFCNDEATAFCCLGVAAKLLGTSDALLVNEDTDAAYDAVFCTRTEGYLQCRQFARELAQRNDGRDGFHKHSFAEIADYIEKNL